MAVLAPDLHPSLEARRASSRHVELPACDGLRQCAAVMAVLQYLTTTRALGFFDLTPGIRACFALTGFQLVSFLLADRGRAALIPTIGAADGPTSAIRALLRSLPISQLAVLVAVVLYLPPLLATQSIEAPELAEWPAAMTRSLTSGLAEFLGHSFEGRSLIAWPLLVLMIPKRLLGLTLVSFLAAGLTVQFSGLLLGTLQPASILVAPSPIDLMALGSLVAAIAQGARRSGHRPLARWAILMALGLGVPSVACWFEGGPTTWGSSAFLTAPAGFGAINFLLKIVATTLVGSLAWRDLGV